MGKIVAVHSYKGGTGKTLLSVNLAASLAKHGKKVCLFDLDFRAPSLFAVLKMENASCWLNDYLNGSCDINKVLVDLGSRLQGNGNFFAALANPSTEAIRDMSGKDRKWEMRALGRLLSLRNALLNEQEFDYLIFDTSPGLQYSSINAIVAADVAIVVTSLDASDIKGTQRMTHELYDLFEKKTGIVVNKVLTDILPFAGKKEDSNGQLHNLHDLPVLDTIACSCDVLRTGGTCIFAEEKPEHPFTHTLERITQKIEEF